MVPSESAWDRYRRHQVHAICVSNDLSLSRDERLELASVILGREIGSFNDLTPEELETVITALRGADYFVALIGLRENPLEAPPQ